MCQMLFRERRVSFGLIVGVRMECREQATFDFLHSRNLLSKLGYAPVFRWLMPTEIPRDSSLMRLGASFMTLLPS